MQAGFPPPPQVQFGPTQAGSVVAALGPGLFWPSGAADRKGWMVLHSDPTGVGCEPKPGSPAKMKLSPAGPQSRSQMSRPEAAMFPLMVMPGWESTPASIMKEGDTATYARIKREVVCCCAGSAI